MASIRRIVAIAVAGLGLAGAWTATAAGNGAFVQHYSFVTTVEGELTNPCTGEPFTATGVVRDTITTTQTPSGNNTIEDQEVAQYSGISPSGGDFCSFCSHHVPALTCPAVTGGASKSSTAFSWARR